LKRLNNWVGLIDGRLNAEPALKFVAKRDEGERDEVVFEESKNGPGESPSYIFEKFKNDETDHPPLLSEFSGPMRLGGHEAAVKIQFSYLVSVQIQETTAESPTDGRKWADWRFMPMLKGAKDYRNNTVYT
jgi:hypothetical protein